MAKLTVFFEDKVLCSHSFENETVHIGRAETNELMIDKPEFAPVHAVLTTTQDDERIIKLLDSNFPLIINGERFRETVLYHGDRIIVKPYSIIYKSTSEKKAPPPKKVVPASERYIAHVANYQFLSGTNVGKIVHLDSPMTLLGEQGKGLVGISKRKTGYFAAVLEKTDHITLNEQPLGNITVQLNHNDVLAIGSVAVHFYLR